LDFRDSKGAIIRPTGDVEQQIGDRYNTYIQQTEKFPVPHQIPSPPKSFTGREELIEQILKGFSQSDTMIGLRGIGGLGKTALAFKLAELLRDRYKDGQIMVDLRGASVEPLTPAQALSKILRYYYPAVPLPESQDELQSLYLSTLNGKCALVLLDNALDDHQVMPLLPPSTCGLIITSRRKFALPGMVPIDLDVLKLEEAVELLLKTARPHSSKPLAEEKSTWKEIAGMCGCLPVALKAAGSYLACTPGSSPKKYIKELQDERKRLGVIGKEGVEEDLVTKFSLSYSRLATETALVFRLLSIFPADFDAQAEEAVCEDEGHRHLIDLTRWSLVEYQRPNPEDEGRYHLHDLVKIYASSQLKKDGEAKLSMAHQRHAAYYLGVLQKANGFLLDGGESLSSGLKLFDLEWSNIQAGQAWAKSQSAANSECSEICNNFAWQGSILNLRLHPQENIRWIEVALACARQLGNQEAEGAHLGNLGLAYAALGDAQKAIEYYEQHLAIAREIGDRRGEVNALGNLGNAYADLGDAKKAIEYYEQAMKIAREIGDRRSEGNALGNLGSAYKDLGDSRKAIEYHEHALAIDREIGDRRGEGADLGNLGSAYYRLGEINKALEYYDQQFDIVQEIGDHYGEANSLWGQAICYEKMNNLDKAIENAEEALMIFEQIESPSASTMRELLSKWRSK
jgi:tetratricopeptide (TPR) repeat protein